MLAIIITTVIASVMGRKVIKWTKIKYLSSKPLNASEHESHVPEP
jgi:hypothetical protein